MEFFVSQRAGTLINSFACVSQSGMLLHLFVDVLQPAADELAQKMSLMKPPRANDEASSHAGKLSICFYTITSFRTAVHCTKYALTLC